MKYFNAWGAVLAIVVVMSACADDYSPRVICHNSNCVEPTNPEDDDTVEALHASLALLGEDGRPLIDGMEIDTFWYGEEERCLFAHDLDHPERAEDAQVAVDIINDFLVSRHLEGLALTRAAEEFSVFIELKGHVTPSKLDKHSPEQLQGHVDCAMDLAKSLADSANDAGYGVEVVFMSFEPEILQGLHDHAEFSSLKARLSNLHLAALQGIPKPLDSQTQPLSSFTDVIDMVSVHPHWTSSGDLHAYDSRGLELTYWMFSIVPETLRAIKAHRPMYVTTSEARAFVGWLNAQ